MQQNQHCTYPQVFWTNNSAVRTPDYALPRLPPSEIVSAQDICPRLPVPARKRHGRNTRDGTCLCFLVVSLLTFLALTGVGLAEFQIFHLQQELDALKEISSLGPALQSPEMLRGKMQKSSYVNNFSKLKSTQLVRGKVFFLHGFERHCLPSGRLEWQLQEISVICGKSNQQSLPLEWESAIGHAFTSGVHYKNRCLVIDEAGLYFVYSKIFFRGRACTNQPLDHVVFKKNPAYPDIQVLMEDRTMNYCKLVHMWGKSSYLGALFNLSRQDGLCVSVSDVSLVNSEESKTFFGLFML